MIKGLLDLFKEAKPDRSETDRLEQRIRDIRERIGRAKSLQESVFPSSRMDVQKTKELQKSGDDRGTSHRERPEISESERLKRKLLGIK